MHYFANIIHQGGAIGGPQCKIIVAGEMILWLEVNAIAENFTFQTLIKSNFDVNYIKQSFQNNYPKYRSSPLVCM